MFIGIFPGFIWSLPVVCNIFKIFDKNKYIRTETTYQRISERITNTEPQKIGDTSERPSPEIKNNQTLSPNSELFNPNKKTHLKCEVTQNINPFFHCTMVMW